MASHRCAAALESQFSTRRNLRVSGDPSGSTTMQPESRTHVSQCSDNSANLISLGWLLRYVIIARNVPIETTSMATRIRLQRSALRMMFCTVYHHTTHNGVQAEGPGRNIGRICHVPKRVSFGTDTGCPEIKDLQLPKTQSQNRGQMAVAAAARVVAGVAPKFCPKARRHFRPAAWTLPLLPNPHEREVANPSNRPSHSVAV
jgi:hypothetical protein